MCKHPLNSKQDTCMQTQLPIENALDSTDSISLLGLYAVWLYFTSFGQIPSPWSKSPFHIFPHLSTCTALHGCVRSASSNCPRTSSQVASGVSCPSRSFTRSRELTNISGWSSTPVDSGTQRHLLQSMQLSGPNTKGRNVRKQEH